MPTPLTVPPTPPAAPNRARWHATYPGPVEPGTLVGLSPYGEPLVVVSCEEQYPDITPAQARWSTVGDKPIGYRVGFALATTPDGEANLARVTANLAALARLRDLFAGLRLSSEAEGEWVSAGYLDDGAEVFTARAGTDPATMPTPTATFVCPITREPVSSGIAGQLAAGSSITGFTTTAPCGHTHTLDRPAGASRWTVDGQPEQAAR
jgi:hypothetical protein